MKIKIENPIAINLELIEVDDRLPSMKFSSKIIVTQFDRTFVCDGSFWFDCKKWERFTESLSLPLSEEILLCDMNGYFIFSLRGTDGGLSLIWKYTKADVGSNYRRLEVAFTSAIDDDMFAKIRDEFRNFPMWW